MSIETLSLASLMPPIALSVTATLALVLSDQRGFRPGRYLCKPLAAVAFVWLALNLGAEATTYGNWLLAGLIFCMVGDLFLMPDNEHSFLVGLTAFLCGHLLFAVAFLQLPLNVTGLAVSAIPVACLLLMVCRWLLPHVERAMKLPVIAYIFVISAMLMCAGLTAGHAIAPVAIVGAWGFALSDLAVARGQFVAPESKTSGLWGTPLYFASQMLLAASVALA